MEHQTFLQPCMVAGMFDVPSMITSSWVTTLSFSVTSQFPPFSAAKSMITEPGFISSTTSLPIKIGAFLPGIRALIPGRKAPILIGKDVVELMKPGSVIMDLAAENGGNCEVTEKDKVVTHDEVIIDGTSNIPATMHGCRNV